jgi:hypothetical protein
MASPAFALKPCVVSVNLFDGWRQPLQPESKILLTVRDGNQKIVVHDEYQASRIDVEGLPFFDNFGDNYTVVAWGSGYEQAGFTPLKVSPRVPATVDIMLLKKDAGFDFSRARWQDLRRNLPQIATLAAAGAADEDGAAARYGDLVEKEPVLACFFNLTTAMSQIQLPDGTPLDYIKELIWDDTMAQDRFFAWADTKLVDQVIQAARQGAFAPEPGTAIFHKGATSSYKQVRFGEANVQLTFHENDHPATGHTEWIKVEPDIDYYKDPLAHALLEVTANQVTHSLTDPRQVYLLRWIAGRHANIPNFDPPYGIA